MSCILRNTIKFPLNEMYLKKYHTFLFLYKCCYSSSTGGAYSNSDGVHDQWGAVRGFEEGMQYQPPQTEAQRYDLHS